MRRRQLLEVYEAPSLALVETSRAISKRYDMQRGAGMTVLARCTRKMIEQLRAKATPLEGRIDPEIVYIGASARPDANNAPILDSDHIGRDEGLEARANVIEAAMVDSTVREEVAERVFPDCLPDARHVDHVVRRRRAQKAVRSRGSLHCSSSSRPISDSARARMPRETA